MLIAGRASVLLLLSRSDEEFHFIQSHMLRFDLCEVNQMLSLVLQIVLTQEELHITKSSICLQSVT